MIATNTIPTVEDLMTDLTAMLEKTAVTYLSTWVICQDEFEVSFSKDDHIIHVVIEDEGFNTEYSRLNENKLERVHSQTLGFRKVSGHFSMTYSINHFLSLPISF